MANELFVSRFAGRTWAAVRVDGRTTELRVETRASSRATVGRIVKARVTRVLPGIQVAFVDVGLERDGFLHVSDLVLPGEEPVEPAAHAVPAGPAGEPSDIGPTDEELEAAIEAEQRGATAPAAGPDGSFDRATARSAPIQDRLREGRELLVQITREPIRSKGPRVSAYLTVPGRMLVYMPMSRLRGVSRRIRDEDERRRLRAVLQALPHPGGFILRTAGANVDEEAVRGDADRLVREWRDVLARGEFARAPAVVRDEGDLLARLLRDAPEGGYDRVVVDRPEMHDLAVAALRGTDPRGGEALAARVELHEGERPLFESHALDQDVERAMRPRVWLKSGGYIVIEPTEALVSIDVNTGKYVGTTRPEETVLRTNLEAAVEIARQLRLRDLGGIIVVDFIDMDRAASRRSVLDALENALADDRARTKIVGISELGLVQLTRKRTRPGLGSLLTRPCPACQGNGRVKGVETVAWEALREVHRTLPLLRPERVTVRAQPEVLREFAALWHGQEPPEGIERALVRLEEDPALDPESFDVELR